MTQDERSKIAQALAHLEAAKELHNGGDVQAYVEERKARLILAELLAQGEVAA